MNYLWLLDYQNQNLLQRFVNWFLKKWNIEFDRISLDDRLIMDPHILLPDVLQWSIPVEKTESAYRNVANFLDQFLRLLEYFTWNQLRVFNIKDIFKMVSEHLIQRNHQKPMFPQKNRQVKDKDSCRIFPSNFTQFCRMFLRKRVGNIHFHEIFVH